MSMIDAAIKELEMIGDCRTCGNKDPFCESNPDNCSGYKWRGAKDDNKPLTSGPDVWFCDGNICT